MLLKNISIKQAEKIASIIDSCKTFEQLMVCQQWLEGILGEDALTFVRKRIDYREKYIDKISLGTPIDSGKSRIH